MNQTNDLDEFSDVVGSDREKLFDVEYIKTVKLHEITELMELFVFDNEERHRVLHLYLNVVHPDMTIEEIVRESFG